MTINGNAQHLTQPELERTLWAAANALRGPVDAGDFKAYVFPVMFFKWISDNWDYRHARAVADWGDDLTPEIEYADYQPFVVPNGCHWSDVHGTAVNVGAKLGDALDRIQEANRDLAGVFGDVQWANTDRLPESALTALLDTFHRVRLDPDHVSGDLLGNAYEYLLREFAEASGKKAGEFFTPRHVVHLLVKILDPQPGDEVVDPACGSGGMLVETVNAVREAGGNPDSLRLHGQEINLTTSAIARMNLYLHGLEDFEIRRGDTFRDPKFTERGRLRKFDVVIANPPFSLQNWGASAWANDPWGRVLCAVPPAKNGDYAWIQHMIASMKADTRTRRRRHAARGAVPRRQGGRDPPLPAREGPARSRHRPAQQPVLLHVDPGVPADLAQDQGGGAAGQGAVRRRLHAVRSPARTRTRWPTPTSRPSTPPTPAARTPTATAASTCAWSTWTRSPATATTSTSAATSRPPHTAEVDVEAALAAYRDAREALRAAERVLDAKLKAAGFDA